MPLQSRALCQICSHSESKYTCSKCLVVYCSVACCKQHQESSCTDKIHDPAATPIVITTPEPIAEGIATVSHHVEDEIRESQPLRPLTSLHWPYVPEESAYPDPLKRDDPKPLQLSQYESIATSPAIRQALATHLRLPGLLASVDKLRGPDREDALQHALGVNVEQLRHPGGMKVSLERDEDVNALRQLAEAVEAAVRGGKAAVLGLDWGDD